MRKIILSIIISLLLLPAFAADKKGGSETNLAPAQVEEKYTAAIEGRTADVLKVLALDDTNKAAQVHDIIIAQYRALKAWHDDNDAKLKAVKGDTNVAAQIRASLKSLHDKFISALAKHLSLEQVEQVKDKLTYGKVQFTYKGYLLEYPDLNDEQKAGVLRLLKEAREEAMDGGSADEKSAIFNRYKGKINNYLSKQGVHAEKSKPKSSAAATNSAPQP